MRKKVCMRERVFERESECVCVGDRECVCVGERECVYERKYM